MNNNSKARFLAQSKQQRRKSASLGYPMQNKRKSKHAKVAYCKLQREV